MHRRSWATPARMRVRAWSPRKPMISRMMGASSGRVKRRELCTTRAGLMESSCTERRLLVDGTSGWAQCMMMQPQLLSSTACCISGSVKPDTSLTMETPWLRHIAAVEAWRVSMDTMALGAAARIPRTTGSTRSASTSGDTGLCPGRVDSPPTSMMSAPSSSISKARRTAFLELMVTPPSEKESGVTLSTPITRGRESESTCSPHCQVA